MKKNSLILTAGLLTAAAAQAATVTWSAAIDTGLILNNGSVLAQGNWVEIGYFGTLTDAQVRADAAPGGNLGALFGDFKTFGSTTIGNNTSAAASFTTTSAPQYSSLNGFAPSSQIYLIAMFSSSNTSLSAAQNSVTQLAIGYVPSASLNTWQFPATDTTATTPIDISSFSNANSVILAGNYVSGNSASLTPIFGSPNHALQLSPVPEPSTLALFGLASLAMMGVRRRKHSNFQA